jgi:hypothetical protein
MSDTFEPYPAYKDSGVPWRGKITPRRESSITQPVIPAQAGIQESQGMDSRLRGNDISLCLSYSAIGDGFPPVRECSHER